MIDLPEDSPYYLRRWTKNGFTKIIELNIEIENTFNNKLQESIRQHHDIIIDMTNFMKSFVKNYEEPEKEEGIDEIIHVDTKKELEYFLNLDKQT